MTTSAKRKVLLLCTTGALVAGALTSPVLAATGPAKIVRYLLPSIKLLNPDGTPAGTVEANKLPVNGTDTMYDDDAGTYSITYDGKTYLVKQGQVQADKRVCPTEYALMPVAKGQVNAGENAGANEPSYQCIHK